MKLSTLQNKLKKANIEFSILDFNGFNKAIVFKIYNEDCEADFNSRDLVLSGFSINRGFNPLNQETKRIYFSNFSKLNKYITKK